MCSWYRISLVHDFFLPSILYSGSGCPDHIPVVSICHHSCHFWSMYNIFEWTMLVSNTFSYRLEPTYIRQYPWQAFFCLCSLVGHHTYVRSKAQFAIHSTPKWLFGVFQSITTESIFTFVSQNFSCLSLASSWFSPPFGDLCFLTIFSLFWVHYLLSIQQAIRTCSANSNILVSLN